jgi:glyoxylase-like metal-dependent hydrolase (beta-lactamase superfamily II)
MTSHGWFDVQAIGPGVTMIREPGHVEDVKSYLIEGERDVAVLDTGMGIGDFYGLVRSLSDKQPLVVQSHAHWDHYGASARFERVLIHPTEADDLRLEFPNSELRPWFVQDQLTGAAPLPADVDLSTLMIPGCEPTGFLEHGGLIDLGERVLEIYHTPGHSPGGVTVLDRMSRLLFPGDAVNIGPLYLFKEQADLVGARAAHLLLAQLADDVDAVYPSHYHVPMTPDDVRATHTAFEEILAGREPDARLPDREVYDYGRFVFWITPGAVAALRALEG